jgi:hypothetical protein
MSRYVRLGQVISGYDRLVQVMSCYVWSFQDRSG